MDDEFACYDGYLIANEMSQRLDRAGTVQAAVLSLINEAVAIERRLGIEERQRDQIGAPTRAKSWPGYVRDQDEHLDAFNQRKIDIVAGDLIESVLGLPVNVDPAEKNLARTVMTILPAALPERNRERDWEILKLLAKGRKSEKKIAADLGVSPSTIPAVKKYKTAAIWRNVMDQTWSSPLEYDTPPTNFS